MILLLVGGIENLVLPETDYKFERSHVHIAHVKESLAVGNRKELAARPLSGQN